MFPRLHKDASYQVSRGSCPAVHFTLGFFLSVSHKTGFQNVGSEESQQHPEVSWRGRSCSVQRLCRGCAEQPQAQQALLEAFTTRFIGLRLVVRVTSLSSFTYRCGGWAREMALWLKTFATQSRVLDFRDPACNSTSEKPEALFWPQGVHSDI